MRRSMVRGGLTALLAILSSAGLWEASAAGNPAAGQAATVRAVTARLEHHQWPSGSFTANTTLQIGTRRWSGTRAVGAWWQSQFRLNLRIALVSSVIVRNGRAEAILRRSTRSGACPKTCWDRATWQFSGSRIARMTLTSISRPPGSGPPVTVPPPPSTGPPKGTPTIPS